MATKESLLYSSSTDRIQMIDPEYTDGSIVQAVEPEQGKFPLCQAEENTTKHICRDEDMHGIDHTAINSLNL